jgi:superfamily II DNA or RNA helicase
MPTDIGILCAGTAFGKTVVAANLIAQRARSTLVLVHRRQLLDQWRESLAMFFDIPVKSIGVIGSGKKKPTGYLDIGMLQSLIRQGEVSDLIADYGHVVVDECHHLSAFSFESVIKEVRAKYVLGLTATPKRRDGHHPIIVMQCGPIRFRVSDKQQAKVRNFEHIVIERTTPFVMPNPNDEPKIHEIYSELSRNEYRNELIVNDLLEAVEAGRSPLLLTERTDHLEYLEKRLKNLSLRVIVLRGGMGRKQREAAMEALTVSNGDKRVILATGKYIGEGFDDERLDTLFLAMPISWAGTLQQYAGRLHRRCDQKKNVQIYDYVDRNVPMLERMFQKRVKGYKVIGYRFIEPGQGELFECN